MSTTAARAAAPATARDVLALLRGHYLPPARQAGGVFAPEIEAPAGGRRAVAAALRRIAEPAGLLLDRLNEATAQKP